MKIKKYKSKSQRNIILCIFVLLLVVAGFLFWYIQQPSNQSPASDSSPTRDEIESGKTAKKETIDNYDKTVKPSSNSDTPATPANGSISASIPYADSTRLTVLIEGVVSGSCYLELSNGTSTITKTVAIQSGPNTSTCEGFSYETLSTGEWSAKITITTPEATGSVTKMIMV